MLKHIYFSNNRDMSRDMYYHLEFFVFQHKSQIADPTKASYKVGSCQTQKFMWK